MPCQTAPPTEGIGVVIQEASQLGGHALGCIHINGGGGRGASAARGAPAPRAGEVALGGSPGAGPGSRPCAKAGSAAASLASGGASRGGH